ncbi:MAG: hypothetical protein NZ804_11830 [Roseibacillus sp.]|nr:hypothetical protein [Roseibacillus sp.]
MNGGQARATCHAGARFGPTRSLAVLPFMCCSGWGAELIAHGVLQKRPGIMAVTLFGRAFLLVQAERRVGLAVAWQSCYLPDT